MLELCFWASMNAFRSARTPEVRQCLPAPWLRRVRDLQRARLSTNACLRRASQPGLEESALHASHDVHTDWWHTKTASGTSHPSFLSLVIKLCPTLWNPMGNCSTPVFPVLHYLPEFTQSHVHWVGDAIQSSHLLLPSSLLPSVFPRIRVFSNESALLIRWPKYWSFSFNISPFNEYSGLISFRIDWFDLLSVQGILRSLLQHHKGKASILQCSTFLMVQLSHHKNIDETRYRCR